ncbi:hypothetical protein EDB86DRAFT_3245437 [Lactarius hatsudake]|nr:hypothetical protein EDB86DRAFT_3245437 [Lactarius hatsudake]
MTLPPQPFLALSSIVALRLPRSPFPVPMRLPRPYSLHVMLAKASPMRHRLTAIHIFQSLIRQPSKASAFMPLPRIPSRLMRCKTTLIHSQERFHSPSRNNIRHPCLILPQWAQPPHLAPLPYSPSQAYALLRMFEKFHRYLFPLRFSTL